MRWSPGKRSGNLRDRRASTGGGGIPLPGKLGGGLGTIIVIIVALLVGTGGDGGSTGSGGGALGEILEQLGGPTVPAATDDALDADAPDPERRQVDFVSFVLDDVQGVWREQFRRSGEQYRDATLELFRGRTSTACGTGTSDTGPFYCPPDQGVYIDLGFFRELSDRFGAPGDFAQAYVIAHEIGHHVQNLLGIDEQVRARSEREPDRENDLSIRQELQADCFAGVWGHAAYTRELLESGDLEEGLAAAESVGDDRIQEAAGADVNPETWTHGSAAQRQTWFRRGYDSGDPERCDTFSADL
ncbi:KPN_02809 family neutral zinc metallopeptidase [Paraconexibacter algicola]|uniref:Metalloprotease n=1 Tax=Paraconexibacter algicola TaxID=2133960 RepID=A0A2T4UIF8_9ACTN|nr:neutral zinc metallopeptidase [Paraconexibacter algicola]PTL59021.1 hypothetical protein C7Y72_04840 [Paraconexibacter algicola]